MEGFLFSGRRLTLWPMGLEAFDSTGKEYLDAE